MKKFITLPLVATMISSFAACGKPKLENTNKIAIFHTNDTHARVKEDKYAGMGFAKIGTILDQARKENPGGVLLMDAGDTFHGQTFATLNEGQSILDIYNTLKYDVLAPGNHDFNYGYERLLELADDAKFKVLSANTLSNSNEKPIMDSTTIIVKKGIKIGIFGLTTPETAYKTHPDNVREVKFKNPIEVSKEKVAELKKQNVNFIVAVGHIGIDKDTEIKSTDIAKAVPEIDLIIDGHSHTIETKTVGDTLIVQTGEYTKNFGKVELYFDKDTKKLVYKKSTLLSKDSQKDTEQKIQINDIIKKYETENEEITSVVVASSPIVLDGERANVRTKETNLGNLIADAMRDKASADFALTNGGGIRDSIDVGPITQGELISVLPFGNIIVKLEVTGKQLKEALAHGYKIAPEASGGFAHVSGLKVVYKKDGDSNKIVSLVKTNGEAIEDDKTYTLATNDYLAAGGDEYSMLESAKKVGEYEQLDEALADYIEKNGANVSVEGRITAK